MAVARQGLLRKLFGGFSTRPETRPARRFRRSRHVLSKAIIETLEPRILLSDFTVTSLADDGSAGTLRSEILAADSNATATGNSETVVFLSSLTGTITLNGNALVVDNSSGNVTIQGPG